MNCQIAVVRTFESVTMLLMMVLDMIEFGLHRRLASTNARYLLSLYSQVDEIVEEECGACTKQPPAITLGDQKVGDALLVEIVLAEEQSITHLNAQQYNSQRKEDGDGIHGMKRHLEIVVGTNQCQQVHKSTERPCRRGLHGRREHLDGASPGVEVLPSSSSTLAGGFVHVSGNTDLIGTLKCGCRRRRIFTANSNTSNASCNGQVPEHVMCSLGLHLESQGGEDTADDYETRSNP